VPIRDLEERAGAGIVGRVPDTWFVYVARCSDGTLYVGVARDVAVRIAQHDAGKGARYTRGRGPLAVLATRRCDGQGSALRLELALKRLSRDQKVSLVQNRRRLGAFARRVLAGDTKAPAHAPAARAVR